MDRHAAQSRGNITPVLWNAAEKDAARDVRRLIPGGGEGAVLKARYKELRRISGPSPSEQLSHYHSRRRFFSARGLQLDIRAETEFGNKHQSLFQPWHALPCEGRMKPLSRVVASDRGERQRAHPAASARRALQPVVVKQNRLAVAGEPDIELNPTATERLCFAQSGESVFRRVCGGAAMADDWREDSFDPLALRRNSRRGGQQMPRRRYDIRGKFAAVPPGIGCRQVAAFTCCS